MSDAKSDRIVLHCPRCQAGLRIPAGAVGRRVKCPKCEHRFVGRAPAPSRSNTPAPDDADGTGSLLDELAAEERVASPTTPPQASDLQSTCPACRARMPADARV